MTPADLLKEIEREYKNYIHMTSEIEWLIKRVKRLTEALENISEGSSTNGLPRAGEDWWQYRARKALENEDFVNIQKTDLYDPDAASKDAIVRISNKELKKLREQLAIAVEALKLISKDILGADHEAIMALAKIEALKK